MNNQINKDIDQDMIPIIKRENARPEDMFPSGLSISESIPTIGVPIIAEVILSSNIHTESTCAISAGDWTNSDTKGLLELRAHDADT